MPGLADNLFPYLSGAPLGTLSPHPIPQMRKIPNNFDKMVVPPFDLPPDKNTIDAQDFMDRRAGENTDTLAATYDRHFGVGTH